MLASWAPKTQQSYISILVSGYNTIYKMSIKELFKASFADGMDFLSELFHNEKGNYGVVAVARSAISVILPKQGSITFGKDNNVISMLKGVFELRPSLNM